MVPANDLFRRYELSEIALADREQAWQGRGVLSIGATGRVSLEVHLDDPDAHISSAGLDHLTLTGQTPDGAQLSAERLTYTASSLSPDGQATMRFTARSFSLDWGRTGPPDRIVWQAKHLRVDQRHSIESQDHRLTLSPLESPFLGPGGCLEPGRFGAQVTAEGTTPGAGELDGLRAPIEWLLTLTQRCLVPMPVVERFLGEDLHSISLYDSHQVLVAARPLLSEPTHILGFVQHALPQFATLQHDYSIVTLIEYYWRAATESTIEIQFLLAATFMEGFKFYWAKNRSGLVQDLAPGTSTIRGFKRSSSDKWCISFKQLLRGAMSSIGATPRSYDFITERNAVFHSGLSSASELRDSFDFNRFKHTAWELMDLLDEVLLRLFEYRGQIHRFSRPTASFEFEP